MRRTGITRCIERSTDRSQASRQTPRPCALVSGTSHPGSGEYSPRPGHLFLVAPPMSVCAFPECLPTRPFYASVFMPLERKSRPGATRRQFHEQGVAI